MATAFSFMIALTILGTVLYGLERNRPGQLRTGRLHGATGVEDRDTSRLETEVRIIADQRHPDVSLIRSLAPDRPRLAPITSAVTHTSPDSPRTRSIRPTQ